MQYVVRLIVECCWMLGSLNKIFCTGRIREAKYWGWIKNTGGGSKGCERCAKVIAMITNGEPASPSQPKGQGHMNIMNVCGTGGDFLKSQAGLEMYSGVNWSEPNIYGGGVFRLQQGEPRLRH